VWTGTAVDLTFGSNSQLRAVAEVYGCFELAWSQRRRAVRWPRRTSNAIKPDEELHMQIEVTTDHNVEGGDALIRRIEAEVEAALSRFGDQLTRVEVHLGDENAGKSGAADKRCMMEARPAGQQPVAVTNLAATLDEARRGALQKLENVLESKFGRLDRRKGGATIRRDGAR
jgi:Sigma 54 modulation protein / S30EA ribosomal protein